MTRSKHTKQALITSVLAMLLCVAMLVGSTFAWFTDSVTTGVNKIVAGNLDVELYSVAVDGTETPVNNETNLFMKDALWEPGHVEVVTLKVANVGTLALKYNLGINIASEKKSTNVFGNEFQLSNYIKFAVIDGENAFGAGDEGRAAAIAAAEEKGSVALSALAADESDTVLYPAEKEDETHPASKVVTMVVYMPTDVDNIANYLTGRDAPEINLGIELVATQTPYEEDSFNNQYDENAAYPTPVASVEELKTAIENAQDGDIIALTEDMALTEELTIDDAITIDGNGKTISGKPITAKADVKLENIVLDKPTNNSNKASLVYAGAGCENLTFDGVTFSNPQWEAIQVTSNELKTLTINNCTFTANNVDSAENKGYGSDADELIRFIHFQPSASAKPVVQFTVTNNTFKNCDKITEQGALIGFYYFGEGSTLTLGNNTFENWATGDVDDGKIVSKMSISYPCIDEFRSVAVWAGEITTHTLPQA